MVTRTVTTVFDDITDQPGASPRWIAISDGKMVRWCDIDLLPDSFKRLQERFDRELGKYLGAGRVRRMKESEAYALLAVPDKPPVEVKRTELPPEGQTKKVLAKSLPPKDQRPIDPTTGRPYTDSVLRTRKRPGIAAWYAKHWQLLGLPEPTESFGRTPRAVEEAYDRYGGLDVAARMGDPEFRDAPVKG